MEPPITIEDLTAISMQISQHYALLWPLNRSAEINIEAKIFTLQAMNFCLIMPGTHFIIPDGSEIRLITFSTACLKEFLLRYPTEAELMFFKAESYVALNLTRGETQQAININVLANLMQEEYRRANREFILTNYLFSILLHLADAYREIHQLVRDTPENQRLQSLYAAINQYYKTEKNTTFYASMGTTTTRSLNNFTKRTLNKRVTALIAERLITEAQKLLCYPQILSRTSLMN